MESMEEKQSPLKQIRLYCLQCVCGSSDEVKRCSIKDCPLWSFRFGKNPFRTKRTVSEEQKEAFRSRMENYRNNKANSE